MRDSVRENTAQEWRQLGFFYDRADVARTWTLTGSRAGLQKFPDALRAYVLDPRNALKSEHEHYGPYMYLKVMTWPDAALDRDGIRGSLVDLERLAVLVEKTLTSARPGETIRIRHEFSPRTSYGLILDVREDSFDPSEADPALHEPT